MSANPSREKTVFLTGGTGYLGEKLARELIEAGYFVMLLARPGSTRPQLPPESHRWISGDLLQSQDLLSSLQECSALLHTAGLVSNWDPDPEIFDRINVHGLQQLLEVAQQAGIQRVVYTSSFFALGPSAAGKAVDERSRATGQGFNDYDRTKILARGLIDRKRQEGMDIICCYPAVIYGPGARTQGNHVAGILEDLMEGKFPGIIGNGKQVWNYAFVDDVARGHRQALEKGNNQGDYLLGGENISLEGFVNLGCSLAGLPEVRRKIPLGLLMLVARLQMIAARLWGRTPDLTPGMVRSYAESWACDDSHAREELGYEGRSLEEGLRQTLHWLRRESGGA